MGLKSRQSNRGIALVVTLIMLVILTISAMGMLLMLKSGVTTAGNIAFRQAAVRVGDLAVEDARTYLFNQNAIYLQSDDPANGYYANYQPGFSPQTFDFTNTTQARQYSLGGVNTFSGYQIYYVIHRMAINSGFACSDPNAGCMFPPSASSSGTTQGTSQSGGTAYNPNLTGTLGLVYYRATIKVIGPRFNNRYIQAFFY